ncbi:MAG: GerW family sporulation protein [Oscillospiraceae bacterium]|nr:GerW family sporulation protein [Oscillospiraceae bacterium]
MDKENAAGLVGMMNASMTQIKEMVDVNTIVGSPIQTPDGSTVIPVSKCSFGFAVGGSEFGQSKNFGGGSGAGVTVSPIGFLVINSHSVSLLPVNPPAGTALDRAIEMAPSMFDKVSSLFKKDKESQE